jgi:hypothetical protein
MNALEFIASIIGSLAWPAAIVMLVLLLRTPLRKLLHELTRFRYGDVEIDFGREVQMLEDQAKTAGLKLPDKTALPEAKVRDPSQIIAEASRLADDFPEPAIGLAWTAVEHELMEALTRLKIAALPVPMAPGKSIELLHDRGFIDDQTRDLLNRMRNLRNAAVHASKGIGPIAAWEAREFIALSEAVIERLRGLSRSD